MDKLLSVSVAASARSSTQLLTAMFPSLIALIASFALSGQAEMPVDSRLCVDGACGSSYLVPEGQLCAGWEFRIEPDWQITDDDLTEATSRRALAWLDENLTAVGFEYELGRLNRLKVLEGFILKSQALNPQIWHGDSALQSYCEWLRDSGFWYD